MDLRGDIVFCDASQGPFTATLPPPASVGSGYVLTYKKTDASGNAVTIAPEGSATIDGQASVQLTVPYQSAQVASNGANWFLLPVLPFAGGVQGPESSTDNALALWDGTNGSALKNSPWTLDPASGVMTVGGTGPGLVSTGDGDIPITPNGSGRSAIKNPSVSGGDQWAVGALGTVTTTQTVGPDTAPIATATLGGDLNLDHAAPTSGFRYWKQWEVTQDGTGGRTPSFRASDGTAAIWPNADEPDWGGQAADTTTGVVAYVVSASVLRMFLGG